MAALKAPDSGQVVRPECGGKSILEILWEELLEVYSDIIHWRPERVDPDHPDWMHQEDAEERGHNKGRAVGLATAIAVIVNPYAPNLEAVRAEAKTRYEEGGGVA